MDAEKIRGYFEIPEVVQDYARAAENVGLWESERMVFCEHFSPDFKLLELGCGAGRIAFGLAELGFKNITATDFSENMIAIARHIARLRANGVDCQVQDATKLPYPPETFDGAIFGFNGLMQVPKRKRRREAMRQIFRALKPGAKFIFTTHDRATPHNANYWTAEEKQWRSGAQDPVLDEFGDIYYRGDHGNIFIHSPVKDEVAEDISESGFSLISSARRSEIADESEAVKDFSDDCIFWIVQKPESQTTLKNKK